MNIYIGKHIAKFKNAANIIVSNSGEVNMQYNFSDLFDFSGECIW